MSKQEKRVKVMKPWLSFYRLRHLGCLPAASATLRMPPGFPHCRSRFGFPKPNVLQRNKQDQYKQHSSAKNQPALLSSLPPFPCDIFPAILFAGSRTRRRLGCWSGLFVVHRGFSNPRERAAGSNLPPFHTTGVQRKGFTCPCASC